MRLYWLLASALILFSGSKNSLVSAGSPYVYGGGCQVLEGKLYYVGGAVNSLGTALSQQSYFLDLAKPFSIDQFNEAPWAPVDPRGNNIPLANFPAVIPQANRSDYLMMLGGERVDPTSFVQILDTDDKSWSSRQDSGSSWVDLMVSTRNPTTYSLSKAAVAQSDTNPNTYMLYGGRFYSGDEKNATYSSMVWQYDVSTGLFSVFNDFLLKVQGHTTFVHGNRLYALGGSNPAGNILYSMDSLPYMDLRNGEVGTVKLMGDIPQRRVGHGSVLIGDKLYVVGGASDAFITRYFTNQYHILDMKTFTWTTKTLTGFNASYMGCLAYYDGVLVHAFGYLNSFPQSTTALIDIKSSSLISSYSKRNTTSTSPSLGVILGSVFGSLLFVLLSGSLAYYLWLRRKKANAKKCELSPLPPPEIVLTNVWTDDLTPNYNPEMLSEHTEGPQFEK